MCTWIVYTARIVEIINVDMYHHICVISSDLTAWRPGSIHQTPLNTPEIIVRHYSRVRLVSDVYLDGVYSKDN